MSSPAPPPRSPFERHPALTLAVLVGTLLVLTDLAFTRAYVWLRAPGPSAVRVRDEVVHHALRPLSSAHERWGPWDAVYHVNSLGMRDRSARVVPLRPAGRRLVLIGDSFTEGIGVDYERTFAGLVGKALEPRGVEVLDAGTASYCPILYERRVRQLLEAGLVFHELAVFVDVGDVLDEVTYKRDAGGNVVSREARRIAEERANRRYEGSVEALWPLERWLKRHTLLASSAYSLALRARARGSRRGAAWTSDPAVFEAYGREGVELAKRHMDELEALLDERGIALTVAVYPWPEQVLAGERDSPHARVWRAWTASRGAAFLDLFPVFLDRGEPARTVRELFIPGDIHWNEAGHAVVAEALLADRARRGTAP